MLSEKYIIIVTIVQQLREHYMYGDNTTLTEETSYENKDVLTITILTSY